MGTQNISLLTLTVLATAVLTAERFVTQAGAVAAAAGPAFGVARAPAAIGERAPVDVIGTAIVTAGGAIASGAYIDVGAAGKAITHAAGKIVAQALEAAAADGDRIEVLLIPSTA
jgi:hypothetical protein